MGDKNKTNPDNIVVNWANAVLEVANKGKNYMGGNSVSKDLCFEKIVGLTEAILITMGYVKED